MYLEQMRERFPEDPLTTTATLLYEQYIDSDDLALACSEAVAYASTAPQIVGSISYVGYANPELSAETLCAGLP